MENKPSFVYEKNEHEANRQMILLCVVLSAILFIVWVVYFINNFAHFFDTTRSINILVNVFVPIDSIWLLSTLVFLKFDSRLSKPGFKYYIVIMVIIVIIVINNILPRKSLLAWVLPVVITAHFYNIKFSRTIFIISLVAMLYCLYAGMFFGEYDAILIGPGIVVDGEIVQPENAVDRFNYMKDLLKEGNNRYLNSFLYYYIPSAAILTAVYLVINGLNIRSSKLLKEEIEYSNQQMLSSKEMELSRAIQLSVLPEAFTTNKNIDLVSNLIPAKDVGGDFYDYYQLDENHIAFVIGDVSGKGVPAAMFMMKTQTCFKNIIKHTHVPSEVLKEVNKTIYEGNVNKMFVTTFIGILNTETGELDFANAGHNRPLICHNGEFSYLRCSNGFVLGGFENAFVKDEQIKLDPGDTMILYTDGVTEARNEKGEFYGEKRVLDLCNQYKDEGVLDLNYILKEDHQRFVNGFEQSDDITYIIFKYRGDVINYKEKSFDAKKEQIPEAIDFVDKYLKEEGLDNLSNKFKIIVDELFSNIIESEINDDVPNQSLYLRLSNNKDKKIFRLVLVDHGKEFNPLEDNKKEGNKKNENTLEKFADEVSFAYVNNKNIVVAKKCY